LLQVLDDGRLTDSQGRTVDFKNTVLIMTSNIGSPQILEAQQRRASYDEVCSLVMAELRQHFRPEFLNRLDEKILFRSLEKDDIRLILEPMLANVCLQLKAQQGITLEIEEQVKDLLAEKDIMSVSRK